MERRQQRHHPATARREPPTAPRQREPRADARRTIISYGFETRAVHAGAAPDPTTGARSTPIYQTTSYVFDDVDHAASLFNLQNFGYIYSRLTNPTVAVLEERVASLEGGRAAVAAASGHAAQFLIFFTLMEPGDEFVASRKLYGGSLTQFGLSFKKLGWTCHFVDPTDPENFRRALTPRSKAIFVESLANPGGIVVDLEAVAAIAHEAGIPLIVDNTLATPYLCRPFEWGADLVVHSTTKFLGGHGNSLGGVVVEMRPVRLGAGRQVPVADRARAGLSRPANSTRISATSPSPPRRAPWPARPRPDPVADERLPDHDRHRDACTCAWSAMSRTRRRSPNSSPSHPRVAWVSYAGLKSSPYHELARKYLPKRRRRGLHLRRQGRLRGRRSSWSKACGCSRTSPISATPAA